MAEFAKAELVARMRRTRDENSKAAGRRVEGQKAFGEKPGEAEALAMIRTLSQQRRPRLSAGEIARVLNERGVPTRKGGKWTRGTVWAVLNPRERQRVPAQ